MVKWLDTNTLQTRRYRGKIPSERSDKSIKYKEMFNLMKEENVLVSDVPVKVVGSKKTNIKSNEYPPVGRKIATEMKYFHENGLTPGAHYKVDNDKIRCLDNNIDENSLSKIRQKLLGEYDEIIELAETNMPIYNAKIENVRRVAFDIEVKGPRGIFPTPEEAEYPVHAVGIYDTDNRAEILLFGINPSSKQIKKATRKLGYRPKIRMYIEEKDLLSDVFDILSDYSIHLSYNGDNFDLPYLHNRAEKLGLKSPIYEGHYRGRKYKEYHIQGGIHIDLYRFFKNRAVRIYAYGAAYQRTRLDDVTEALLNAKKVEHDLWFDEMSIDMMIIYTITDVKLTLELTTYSDNLTWNLILVLMRVGKMSITFVNRESISKWVLNWIAYEHERNNCILPNKKDILNIKGQFESKSEGGKQFKGGIVLNPSDAGVYWDVLVADYASLYPSVIKKYNLSYETLRCDHPICKNNTVPELDHWVCTKRVGIMSANVGFIRDARVQWYKRRKKESKLADTIQSALKVFINASYGVFGARSFELFCPPVAESTTAYSRNALLEAKRIVEEDIGLTVIYGDTDSIFIHKITEQQFMKLKMWSIVELGIQLGIDYRFRFLVLSGRKKNYFGITTEGKLILKGLQVKKRNTALFIQEMFETVANEMKKVKNNKELEEAKTQMIQIIRTGLDDLEKGNIELTKLARVATLNKKLEEYESKSTAVQAAIQVMDDDKDDEIKKGYQFMVVSIKPRSFPIKTSKFKYFRKGENMECKFRDVDLIKDFTELDIEKYKESVRKAFKPIFESFEMDWQTTVEGYSRIEEYFIQY